MTDTDLESQLDGLFSDLGPGSQVEPYPSQLEEALTDLLKGEAAAQPAVAEPVAVEAPAPISVKPEEAEKEHPTRIPPLRDRLQQRIMAGEQRARVSNTLHSVTTLGGILLFVLLTGLVWRDPTAWLGFRILYIAGYAVAILVTLIQWAFSYSLKRVLQESENRLAQVTRPQTLLRERMDELAAANARLQKSALQLQTVTQITRSAFSMFDPDELAQAMVKLICERFDLHYVGLFLTEESGQWAVLRAGIGKSGRRMLAQGYQLEVGGKSIVGWCIANAQAHVVPHPDASSPQEPLEVSLLPGTRTEAALPLRSRGLVIGALDVHSTDHGAISKEDVAILQTLADHIALAIDNARSLTQTQAKLREIEAGPKHTTRERWLDALSRRAGEGPISYERVHPGITPLDDAALPGDDGLGEDSELGQAIERALAHQEVVVRSQGDGAGQTALVAPISLRGETLGALGLTEREGQRRWTDDEVALIEAVADQMALAIENARLLEETRQHAERERLITDISAKVRASTDVDTILRTAIRELGRALRASEGVIRLEVGEAGGALPPTPPIGGAEEGEGDRGGDGQ